MLAWIIILASAVLTPISLISLLMILVGSYGSASTTVFGFLSVIVAPPATLVAGIGLLRRRAWARYYLLALFAIVLAVNLYDFFRADPEPTHYVSPSGVPTTVLPTDRTIFVPLILLSAGMLAALLVRRVSREFARTEQPRVVTKPPQSSPPPAPAPESRQWRVGHAGRDPMYYEEFHDGAWRRIDIDGEMLMGATHHAVYLASPERWRTYPEWARHRRDEIIARIKSELREPDYDYSHPGGVPSARSNTPPWPRGSRWATILAVVILSSLAVGTGWLVYDGIGSGETILAAKMASHSRAVLRASEPILFWFSIGLYAMISAGCVGLVGWGVTQTRRAR